MKTSRASRRFTEMQRLKGEIGAMKASPMGLNEQPRNRRERRQAERDARSGKAVLGPWGRKD